MKKVWFLSCGLGVVFLVATVLAGEDKHPAPSDAKAMIEALTKQLDSMQSKLTAMEQRLAKLEKSKDQPIRSDTPITIVPRLTPHPNDITKDFADPLRPPKILGEGECNGWKYYVIPLSAKAGGNAQPIPLTGEAATAR